MADKLSEGGPAAQVTEGKGQMGVGNEMQARFGKRAAKRHGRRKASRK